METDLKTRVCDFCNASINLVKLHNEDKSNDRFVCLKHLHDLLKNEIEMFIEDN